MEKPALGQRVKAVDRIVRAFDDAKNKEWRDKHTGRPHYSAPHFECWKRSEHAVAWKTPANPVEGIYVGRRTISNGSVDCLGSEEGNYWEPNGYLECWLIIPNERQNPVRVFPEDVEII